MKKLLYILMFVPFGLFGQTNDPCYSVNNIYTDIINQNPPLNIDLSTGWNLIGYPCSEPIDAEEAFNSIVENIDIVKNNAADVYWPEFNFNGIGQLETLEGYQIKLNNLVVDFSFCSPINLPDYPGCTDCGSLNFNPFATSNDGSCNYDSDGDGIYDADEIVGCLDQLACNYDNVIGATDNGGCIFPEEGNNCFGNELVANIGDTVFGGIVFYIDETGEHGLVVALEDVGQFKWGCMFESLDGAAGASIGTGLQNTIEIVSECSETPIAASEALAFESGGYDDWYLPSSYELLEIFNQTQVMNSDNYWTSTEDGVCNTSVYAWSGYYSESTGYLYGCLLNKDALHSVRAIRAF